MLVISKRAIGGAAEILSRFQIRNPTLRLSTPQLLYMLLKGAKCRPNSFRRLT